MSLPQHIQNQLDNYKIFAIEQTTDIGSSLSRLDPATKADKALVASASDYIKNSIGTAYLNLSKELENVTDPTRRAEMINEFQEGLTSEITALNYALAQDDLGTTGITESVNDFATGLNNTVIGATDGTAAEFAAGMLPFVTDEFRQQAAGNIQNSFNFVQQGASDIWGVTTQIVSDMYTPDPNNPGKHVLVGAATGLGIAGIAYAAMDSIGPLKGDGFFSETTKVAIAIGAGLMIGFVVTGNMNDPVAIFGGEPEETPEPQPTPLGVTITDAADPTVTIGTASLVSSLDDADPLANDTSGDAHIYTDVRAENGKLVIVADNGDRLIAQGTIVDTTGLFVETMDANAARTINITPNTGIVYDSSTMPNGAFVLKVADETGTIHNVVFTSDKDIKTLANSPADQTFTSPTNSDVQVTASYSENEPNLVDPQNDGYFDFQVTIAGQVYDTESAYGETMSAYARDTGNVFGYTGTPGEIAQFEVVSCHFDPNTGAPDSMIADFDGPGPMQPEKFDLAPAP